jgi:hypothetical protein
MRQCSLAGLRFPKNARFDVSCEEKWRLRSVACIMGGRPALAPPQRLFTNRKIACLSGHRPRLSFALS